MFLSLLLTKLYDLLDWQGVSKRLFGGAEVVKTTSEALKGASKVLKATSDELKGTAEVLKSTA